jgi:predicted O-methyltransferase YrrM
MRGQARLARWRARAAGRLAGSSASASTSHELWSAVDGYISDRLVGEDSVSSAALAASAAAALPPITVSANQGKLLELLVRVHGARRILELGTLGAYSTIWLARALPPDGRLVTLEADPRFAEVARANLADAGLAEVVEVRVGAALETLPEVAAEGARFDLIFIDADKANYAGYLEWALKLSRPGTLIVADNVVRDGAIINADGSDPWHERGAVEGLRRFYDLLAAEPGVSATAIQTVGEKGYDGFAVVLVTAPPSD